MRRRQPSCSVFQRHPSPHCLARFWRRTALICAIALSAACSTRTGDGEPLDARAAPADVSLSLAKVAELEKEVERLKAENTKLIGRLLGLSGRDPTEQAEHAIHLPAAVENERPLADPGADAASENEAGRGEIAASRVLHGVQLASYRRLVDVQEGWRKLQHENPDELGRLEPRVETVTVPDKGQFLRLIGGGFVLEHEAAALCSTLKGKGLDCSIVRFEDERLSAHQSPEAMNHKPE